MTFTQPACDEISARSKRITKLGSWRDSIRCIVGHITSALIKTASGMQLRRDSSVARMQEFLGALVLVCLFRSLHIMEIMSIEAGYQSHHPRYLAIGAVENSAQIF